MEDNSILFNGLSGDTRETDSPTCPHKDNIPKQARKKRTKEPPKGIVIKPKTSLYLTAEKMHALRVHCAEEDLKITTFVEIAIDEKIKSDLRKRKNQDVKE